MDVEIYCICGVTVRPRIVRRLKITYIPASIANPTAMVMLTVRLGYVMNRTKRKTIVLHCKQKICSELIQFD